jgi:FKBP-type peptidyl-prolyl cis-trans isomerase SlyD
MSSFKNKVIVFHFKLSNSKGEVLENSFDDEPMAILAGTNHILPKIEAQLQKMQTGEKATISLKAADAYGEYDEENVNTLTKNQFPENVSLTEGMEFVATDNDDGKQSIFYVKEIAGENIVVDFNHPLAGEDLTFDIELTAIRAATKEEIEHGHAHGPSGSHDH